MASSCIAKFCAVPSIIEPIHVVNMSVNMSLNDDHQILKYQLLELFILYYQPYM